MTIEEKRDRYRKAVAAYRAGFTMREVAVAVGLTLGRVQQILAKEIPSEIRPMHVIPSRRKKAA